MKKKIVDGIIGAVGKAIEKFFNKFVCVKRGYEENVLLKGFHTIRFHAFMWQYVILGSDPKKNKKKIKSKSEKLVAECRRQVENDITAFLKSVSKRKKKGKKKKKKED